MKSKIKIVLADDHILLRHALAGLVNSFDDCEVMAEVDHGNELIELLSRGRVPDLILLDLNMPKFDGYDTAKWIKENCPTVSILMLTMYDSEIALIRLLKVGVKGFLKKDVHPSELKFAIHAVMESGHYYSHGTTGRLMNLFRNSYDNVTLQRTMLSEAEIQFLKLTCTEFTYKEIAEQMDLTPRAVDNLRDTLFTKLDAKSRVGLAMFAIKQGLVHF